MFANDNKNCICTGPICGCGAHGVVKDGAGVRVPAHMMDGAATSRVNVIDQTMIDAEVSKPEYAGFKGMLSRNGTPLDQHYAMMNLVRDSSGGVRAEAARDHMIHLQGNAYKHTVDDSRPSLQFARDGRPMSALNASEQAREEMIARMGSH